MIRALIRSLGFGALAMVALCEFLLRAGIGSAGRNRHARAAWLRKWSRAAYRLFGLKVEVSGELPSSGFLVCNHLGYLDIIALAGLHPCVFVAKSDVMHWPVFGWLARAAGTIFVDRTSRRDTARTAQEIRLAIQDGLLLVLFPEGTSSGGETVLPFKSSLLQPALDSHCPVIAGALDYTLPGGGSVADEVCYWGDMVLVPHLLHLFSVDRVHARIQFAQPMVAESSRKQLATTLRDEIIRMRVSASPLM